MTRHDFRPMGGLSGYLWVIGTGIAGLAVSVYGIATDPGSWPYALFGIALIAFFAFLIVRSKQWVEVTDEDIVLVQRRAFKTVRVGLPRARELYLRGNGGGSAQLVAKGEGGKAFATLLIASLYAQGYQRAEVLVPLLQGAERNRSKGAAATAELLRRQLEHVRAAGPVASAPLAELATGGIGAIGAIGAAGATGIIPDL